MTKVTEAAEISPETVDLTSVTDKIKNIVDQTK